MTEETEWQTVTRLLGEYKHRAEAAEAEVERLQELAKWSNHQVRLSTARADAWRSMAQRLAEQIKSGGSPYVVLQAFDRMVAEEQSD